jgi:hypothetical protein
MTMRQLSIAFFLLGLTLAATSVAATAQPVRDSGACAEITAACQAAGFMTGAAASGSGLIADCVAPLMQGTNQPREARNPSPQVDARLIADCRASNPRFGQGGLPPQEQPSPATKPAPVVRKQPAQTAVAGTGNACAATAEAIPSGLAFVLPSGQNRGIYRQDQYLQALSNPFMSGVAVQINWRDIEPVQGKPDWSKFDELLAAAESSGKWVQIAIFPGFFSPEWALQGAKTDLFAIPYGPGSGTVTKLPMPWDRIYLNRWFAFVRQVGERYGKSPAFRIIAAAGPTSVSEETTLPGKLLDNKGYTQGKYLGAWEEAFHVYAQAFPNQCVSLATGNKAIVEPAMRVFGRRLAIQTNDLHAGRAEVEAPDATEFIKSYNGRIITGFEMRGGSQGLIPSKVMGAEGDPPLALRRAIDKGMAPNNAGRRINYLEIYIGDVLPADMQPVLQYAASLFPRLR